MLPEHRLERFSRLPRVVYSRISSAHSEGRKEGERTMRDLGSDVVRDVRLANPVQDVGTDRAEEVTVDGAERAAGDRKSVV